MIRTPLDACPLCSETRLEDIAQRTWHLPRHPDPVTINYAKCPRCSFFFATDPPSSQALTDYYGNNKQQRTGDLKDVDRRVLSDQARFLTDWVQLSDGQTVLEIGPDGGQFLDVLRESVDITGCFNELNDCARNILSSKGYQADDGVVSVQALVARHVLEHIADPAAAVAGWLDRVSPEGGVFIEVPDWSALDAHTNGLTFEHLNHFSASTLARTVEAAGGRLLSLETALNPDYPTARDRVLRVVAVSCGPPQNDEARPLRAHLRQRESWTAAICDALVALPSPVAIWGASWQTSELMASGRLPTGHVTRILDSDPAKHGTELHGVVIHDPATLDPDPPAAIAVISSYEDDIVAELHERGYDGVILRGSDIPPG